MTALFIYFLSLLGVGNGVSTQVFDENSYDISYSVDQDDIDSFYHS